jgi:hypothetical protein
MSIVHLLFVYFKRFTHCEAWRGHGSESEVGESVRDVHICVYICCQTRQFTAMAMTTTRRHLSLSRTEVTIPNRICFWRESRCRTQQECILFDCCSLPHFHSHPCTCPNFAGYSGAVCVSVATYVLASDHAIEHSRCLQVDGQSIYRKSYGDIERILHGSGEYLMLGVCDESGNMRSVRVPRMAPDSETSEGPKSMRTASSE